MPVLRPRSPVYFLATTHLQSASHLFYAAASTASFSLEHGRHAYLFDYLPGFFNAYSAL